VKLIRCIKRTYLYNYYYYYIGFHIFKLLSPSSFQLSWANFGIYVHWQMLFMIIQHYIRPHIVLLLNSRLKPFLHSYFCDCSINSTLWLPRNIIKKPFTCFFTMIMTCCLQLWNTTKDNDQYQEDCCGGK